MKTKSWRAQLRGHGLMLDLEAAAKVFLGLTLNQPLLLTREPDNPVDPNAILVGDLFGVNFAYVQRQVAAKVAPIMDSGLLVMAKIIRTPVKIGQRGIYAAYDAPVALLWTEEEETTKEEEREAPRPKERELDKLDVI